MDKKEKNTTLRALVTGASGFIGSHLAEYLYASGWSVTCLLRPTSRLKLPSPHRFRIIRGDMSAPKLLEDSVREQDYIFHSAARIRAAHPQTYHRANVGLTEDLIRASRLAAGELQRFVYISSIAASGNSDNLTPKDESMPDNPKSIYGRTKQMGEHLLLSAGGKPPFSIIRPPNVYGPRQQETEGLIRLISSGILPKLSRRSAPTSLIYIRDLVRGMVECALAPQTEGRLYYLTDGCPRLWGDVIAAIQRQLDREFFIPLPQSVFGAAAWIADILTKSGLIQTMFGRKSWDNIVSTPWLFKSDKAAAEFNFRPAYSLTMGIRETLTSLGIKTS